MADDKPNPKKEKIVALRTHIMRFSTLEISPEQIEKEINEWFLEMCIKRASPMLHSKTLLYDKVLQYDFFYTVYIEV